MDPRLPGTLGNRLGQAQPGNAEEHVASAEPPPSGALGQPALTKPTRIDEGDGIVGTATGGGRGRVVLLTGAAGVGNYLSCDGGPAAPQPSDPDPRMGRARPG